MRSGSNDAFAQWRRLADPPDRLGLRTRLTIFRPSPVATRCSFSLLCLHVLPLKASCLYLRKFARVRINKFCTLLQAKAEAKSKFEKSVTQRRAPRKVALASLVGAARFNREGPVNYARKRASSL